MSGPDGNGGSAAGEKAEDAAPKHINLQVKDQDNNEVSFKLKWTSPMEKLMNAYASQQGKSVDSLRFIFDGVRINQHDNASTLQMQDGDIIDVFQEQQGGCASVWLE